MKHYIIEISRHVFNIRGVNRIMKIFKFDYHKFFRLIMHEDKNLNVNRIYTVYRKLKGVIFELDLYKPTERSIYFSGVYERENLRLILKHIKPNGIFVDVGAHVGFFSIIIAKYLVNNGGGQVLSFEPCIGNYSKLIKNIGINSLEKIIKSFPFALSNTNDEKTLYLNPYNEGGNSLEKLSYQALSEEKAKCIRFDDFNEIDKLKISFIKIDVEGHQMKVLEGMKNTISKFHPTFLIEAIPNNDQTDIINFLKQFGYSTFSVTTYGVDILCKH